MTEIRERIGIENNSIVDPRVGTVTFNDNFICHFNIMKTMDPNRTHQIDFMLEYFRKDYMLLIMAIIRTLFLFSDLNRT